MGIMILIQSALLCFLAAFALASTLITTVVFGAKRREKWRPIEAAAIATLCFLLFLSLYTCLTGWMTGWWAIRVECIHAF